MKYIGIIILVILLLIAFDFIFYRSLPIIGSFPVIKSRIELKANGEITLVIIQKGTYQISLVSLYYKGKMIYTETGEDPEPPEINDISDLPKVKKQYKERKVYISLPKNAFDKISLTEGTIFNLECYGSFDQYLSASGCGFNVESKVIRLK
jgi:hypothetical protein